MARPEGTKKCAAPGCERGTIFTPWCRKHRKEHEAEVTAMTAKYHAQQKKKAMKAA